MSRAKIGEEEIVVTADGRHGFTLTLPKPPILPSSLTLSVEEPGHEPRTWEAVDNMQASGSDSRVYSLDAETGEIRFGDGAHGRVPPAGSTIRVRYSSLAGILGSGFVRNRYFYGKLLIADDLETEQQYHIGKRRLLNRCLWGCRVTCGLGVSATHERVTIAAGLALDCCGREIFLPEPIEVALGERRSACFLTIWYSETGTAPVPAVPEGDEKSRTEFSRIAEGYQVQWEDTDPLTDHAWHDGAWVTCGESHGVTLARILREGDAVTLDEVLAERIEAGRRCWCS